MSSDRSAPLVLIGGTFDPPHIGHLVLAECARAQFHAEVAVFLPAGDPWRKTGTAPGPAPLTSRAVTPGSQRLEMVRLATSDNPNFRIDDREVRRTGPSYTVETLEELHREGRREIVLVLGSDALTDLPNWKDPHRIRELATLAIAAKAANSQLATRSSQLVQVDMPRLDVSSTEIRARVAAGRPIRYLVPDAVEAYIAARRLYWAADR